MQLSINNSISSFVVTSYLEAIFMFNKAKINQYIVIIDNIN